MEVSKEVKEKIEELRNIENQLQSFLAQKQTMQIELNEIKNALDELKKTNGEVYKIVSGIMMQFEKEAIEKDLIEKNKFIETKIKAIEKQEQLFEKKSLDLRKQIDGIISQNKEKTKK